MNGENNQTVKNNKNKIYFKAYANYNVWKMPMAVYVHYFMKS